MNSVHRYQSVFRTGWRGPIPIGFLAGPATTDTKRLFGSRSSFCDRLRSPHATAMFRLEEPPLPIGVFCGGMVDYRQSMSRFGLPNRQLRTQEHRYQSGFCNRRVDCRSNASGFDLSSWQGFGGPLCYQTGFRWLSVKLDEPESWDWRPTGPFCSERASMQ